MAKTDLSEIGTSGLNIQGGVVYDEPLPELSGERWQKAVIEMVNDPTVGAVLSVIELTLRQVDRRVQPADQEPASLEAAEFISKALGGMGKSWSDTMSEIVSFVWWGWAWLEIVYKQGDGGAVLWDNWNLRRQETLYQWGIDSSGKILAMQQMAPPRYQTVTIPFEKSLLFRTTAAGNNPEGKSILRKVWISYYYLKQMRRIEAIGVSRDLTGLATVFIPSENIAQQTAADVAIYNAYVNAVTRTNRGEQEGLVLASDRDEKGNRLYEFQLLTSGGARQFNTGEIIQRYKTEIAMTAQADFMMVGHEQVGSFSLHSDKTAMFAVALGTYLNSIAETINTYAIPALLKLNGYNLTAYPKLVFGDIEKANLTALADFVAKLAGAGVLTPSNELENYLRKEANLPQEEGE